MKSIQTVSVFGAGTMGKGIALLFASRGFSVTLFDVAPDMLKAAPEQIAENLGILVDNEILQRKQAEETLARIRTTDSFEDAARDADLVIECIVEKLEAKQECFQRLDALCDPEVILASNTSVISITQIAEKAVHRERIVGTHFWNPPYLIPLVEVVKTVHVSDETVTGIFDALKRAGKMPVLVKKDVPGFLANRIQNAMGREALSIVQNGIADPKDVDIAVKYSFGMRLGAIGPLEQSDAIGLDLCRNIHEYLYPYLENTDKPFDFLNEKIEKGELGFKTGGVGLMTWTPEEQKAYNEALLTNLIKVGKALDIF